jgi:OmpA-OmpF porin, OOP family
MSNSMILSLTNLLDSQAIYGLAVRLGESEESVSKGLGAAMAAILGGMANKTKDPGGLRQIFDMIAGVPTDLLNAVEISNEASGGAMPPALVDMGQRLLPVLFEGNQSAVVDSIAQGAGISPGAAARLMSFAAPIVLGFLGTRVRERGMDVSEFTNLLHRESSSINAHLPAGLSSAWSTLKPAGAVAAAPGASPVSVKAKGPSWWLVLAIAALAILFGIIWYVQRAGHSPGNTNLQQGATRARAAVPGLGDFIDRELPGDARINVPQNGVESRLLEFIRDGARPVGNTWFDFDRLTFDSGSAILRPESEEQLQNIAAIMKAYPNLRLKIGGYTDNTGNAAANLRLSQLRADTVTRELGSMGVAQNRLEGEGYGNEHPAADNSTAEGRAKNRRISMRVLQK